MARDSANYATKISRSLLKLYSYREGLDLTTLHWPYDQQQPSTTGKPLQAVGLLVPLSKPTTVTGMAGATHISSWTPAGHARPGPR